MSIIKKSSNTKQLEEETFPVASLFGHLRFPKCLHFHSGNFLLLSIGGSRESSVVTLYLLGKPFS